LPKVKKPAPEDVCACLGDNPPDTCDGCTGCGVPCWIADADRQMAGAGPLERRQPPLDDESLGAWLKHHGLDELPPAWQAQFDKLEAGRRKQQELIQRNQAASKRMRKHGHTEQAAADVPIVKPRRPGRPPIEVPIEPTPEIEEFEL
jgi:hypothetical protein